MTDQSHAFKLLDEVYGPRTGRSVKQTIGDALTALQRRERRLDDDTVRERQRQWTQRRVETIWQRTARRIDHYEIEDLTAVAVEEARIERQRLQARQDRLAALIAAEDARSAGRLGERERGMDVGLDMSGNRAVDPADEDQRNGWGR